MHHLQGTIAARLAPGAPRPAGLLLAPGAQLVARVAAPAGGDGRGLLSLAGMLLEARLPAGVMAGQRLRLTVSEAGAGRVVLRILQEGGDAAETPAAAARLAGALALSGDGELLRAAMGLAGSEPLLLPDGGAAEIVVEEEPPSWPDAAGGEAAFVLHSPVLGAVEVRLRLAGDAVRADVTVAAGDPTRRAEAALPELVAALGRGGGRASAGVRARPAQEAPPPPPPALRGFSAYG